MQFGIQSKLCVLRSGKIRPKAYRALFQFVMTLHTWQRKGSASTQAILRLSNTSDELRLLGLLVEVDAVDTKG